MNKPLRKLNTPHFKVAITKDLKEIGEDYGLDCVMVNLDNELRKTGIVDENGDWNFEEEE